MASVCFRQRTAWQTGGAVARTSTSPSLVSAVLACLASVTLLVQYTRFPPVTGWACGEAACRCSGLGARGEPALLLGDARRLDPVLRVELLNRHREIIAYGPLREEQRRGDIGDAGAVRGGGQHHALALGERIHALAQRRRRQRRVHHPLPRDPAADRRPQLRGGAPFAAQTPPPP